jgi:hypothetical protein
MAFENRRYVIIPTAEINNVDFDEVLETSAETCRYSVDGTLTFVKYDGPRPPSVPNYQEYTHSEIIEILNSEIWTTLDLE